MAEASEQYENKANGRNNLSSDQSSQTASAFSPLEYPRFYVASTGNKLAATLFAILLGVPSMVGLWYLCAGPAINDPTERFLSPACLGALLALCLWTALSAYCYKVVLRTDRIEYQALLARWSLSRDRIGNWRQCRIQGGKSLELTSTESNTVVQARCDVRFLVCRLAERGLVRIEAINRKFRARIRIKKITDIQFNCRLDSINLRHLRRCDQPFRVAGERRRVIGPLWVSGLDHVCGVHVRRS